MNNTRRSTQTRNAILNAATSCFSAYGYDATGVAEICDRAMVSKGAFYYHFESKEAVFLELIDAWLNNLEQTLKSVITCAQTVPAGLLEMSDNIQPVIENNPEIMGLFLELWTHASRNEKVRSATIAPYHRYQEIFTELIQRGIAEGSFKPVEPATAGQLLLSLFSGFFLQAALDPNGVNWGLTIHESLNILLNGLRED
ncbi:MAG: TetR/AcrR family transcriptional regulator [Bacillota bacterium]